MSVDEVIREKGEGILNTIEKEVECLQPLYSNPRCSIVFFLRFAYSKLLAAPPQEYFTQAITMSALSIIHSLQRIMAYLLGTFSNGGQYRSVKVIFKYCNTLWELPIEI